MVDFPNHATKHGSILALYNLGYLVQSKRFKCTLLINRGANFALYLLYLYCCYVFASLSSKYFFQTDATCFSDRIRITHLAQRNYRSLNKIVRVR